jgi:transposase
MIQLTAHMKILIAIEAADFRNGIDGLAAICRTRLNQNPYDGGIFLFRNRRGTAIKILAFDGLGYYLVLRRFSKGRLKWWPDKSDEPITQIAARELQVLLNKGIPQCAQFEEEWRPLPIH